MTPPTHRYLGVQPFQREHQHLFFGRDAEIQQFCNLIDLEKLLVLFGKSGYGKSSLLNAGVAPRMEGGRQPCAVLAVRVGAYNADDPNTPIDKLRTALGKRYAPLAATAFLDDYTTEKSLWYWFKRSQPIETTDTARRYLLVFDQFEEFFTHPLAAREAFKKELAELLYSTIPQVVRDRADNAPDAIYDFLAAANEVRVVFAIRADRMSQLDTLKDALPAILHKRYELKALTPTQARAAITQPAALTGDFVSPAFEYTPAALEKIIRELTTQHENTDNKAETTEGIEAFQLQLLGEHIESLVLRGDIADIDGNGLPDITPELLPDMRKLYADYYHRKLTELSDRDRPTAQRILEEGLLAEDAATGELRRMSVDSNALVRFGDKNTVENLLEALKNTFLIRAELNSFGGNSYEISHDTLLEPIQATKRERLALENEARLAAEAVAAKIENERIATQLAHEQAQKAELEAALKKTDEALEKAHSAIKTTERFTRIAVAVAFVAVGLGISAATLYFYANQQTRIAQEQTSIAQKNEQKSQNSLIEINVKEYIATGDGFANSKLIEEARAEYEKAAKKIDDIKPIDNKDTRVSLRKEVEVRLKELITE